MLLFFRNHGTASAPPVVEVPDVVCTIDGVEQNALLESFRISRAANSVDTLSCEMDSEDGSDEPERDAEIIVEDDGERIFGGYVDEPERGGLADQPDGARTTFKLTAKSFDSLADRLYFNGTLAAGTLKSQLQTILTETLLDDHGITLDPTQADGPDLVEQTFDYVKSKDILDQLSLLSGFLWEIDFYKVLRMVEPGTVTAPFDLADGDENTEGDVKVTQPRSGDYCNYVVVRAGAITSIASDAGEIASRGVWMKVFQAPPETTTQESADAMSAAILARSLPIVKRAKYLTAGKGVAPNQMQTIVLDDRDLSNFFILVGVDYAFQSNSMRLMRSVEVIEGLVYQVGWREQYKGLGGGGTALPGFVGGGTTFVRAPYTLAASSTEFVRSSGSPAPDWVPLSEIVVQINTIPRGTTSGTVIVRLRARDEGMTLKARIYDITADAPCPGESDEVTQGADDEYTLKTFTTTLTAGSHLYRIEGLPGAADALINGVGYLE